MKPGPAVAQQLGPMGVNMGKVISDVNEATKGFKGMKVPVELEVDTGTKEFEVQVFSPPVSELIKKEAGLEKGSGLQDKAKVANLSIEQIISVAKAKMGNLLCNNLKNAVKTVSGSCATLGILIENKPANEIAAEVNKGTYDKEIEGEIIEASEEKKKEMKDYFNEVKDKQEKILAIESKAKEEAKAAAPVAAAPVKEAPKSSIKKIEKK